MVCLGRIIAEHGLLPTHALLLALSKLGNTPVKLLQGCGQLQLSSIPESEVLRVTTGDCLKTQVWIWSV